MRTRTLFLELAEQGVAGQVLARERRALFDVLFQALSCPSTAVAVLLDCSVSRASLSVTTMMLNVMECLAPVMI